MSPSQSHPGEELCAGQEQASTAPARLSVAGGRAQAGGELGLSTKTGKQWAIVGSVSQLGFPQLVVFKEI